MSLRTDIHTAFDAVTPSTAGMAERVVETAHGLAGNKPRRGRFVLRARVPMALVAAAIAVAIVTAALLGLRLSNGVGTNPAGPPQTVQQLLSRPMQVPLLGPDQPCPDGPRNRNGVYGAGPAYVFGSPGTYPTGARTTAWGTYWDTELVMDSGVTGMVVVRARDLRTGQPVVFLGPNAAGPVTGVDVVAGRTVELRAYLALDPAHPEVSEDIWNLTAGLARGTSYCTGWQVDGANFTETWEAAKTSQ